MQAARDKSDQHSYFYVVWPEEKSAQESQVTLPSPQHPREQSSPKMETAASTGSSQDTSGATKEAATSQRFTESQSPPVMSPRPETEYLSGKQQVVSSSHTVDPSIKYSTAYSPVHPYRAQTAGHQLISLPAPAIVNLTDPQQVLLSADPSGSKDVSTLLHHEARIGEHSSVVSPTHKQLLQMTSPIITGSSSVPRGQEVESFRKIGFLAEQAALNLQKILQTTSKYQPLTKLASSQSSTMETEQQQQQLPRPDSYPGTPPAKRFCSWESAPAGVCMECEVKMAEIQILRKKIHSLHEQMNVLGSRPERLFPSPLLTTATIEPPRIQHPTKPEKPRLPLSLSSLHPDPSFPVEQLPLATSSGGRARKNLETKFSSAPQYPPSTDTQQSGSGNELMTELVSGSGVYIVAQSLIEARKEARSGTQLARKLMDIFWDKDTLAKSTLTPRSKFQYQQLDPKIIKTIEAYCLQYDDTVHSKDIHATMTDKCCQARSRIRTLQPESLSDSPKQQQQGHTAVLYSLHS